MHAPEKPDLLRAVAPIGMRLPAPARPVDAPMVPVSFPQSVSQREAELRAEAGARLIEVVAGAPAQPLTPALSRAMAQVAFRARHATLDGRPASDGRLARVFLALLAHPDLEESDLAWVAQDQAVCDVKVLAAVLEHPSCTPEVMVCATRHALWRFKGALQWEEWTTASPIIPLLAASGHAGRALTLLLALWQDHDAAAFASAARRLLAEGPEATEILATLTSDFRTNSQRVIFCLSQRDLIPLLDQAILLARRR